VPGTAILADPWWIPVLWVLVAGHVTNHCVTLYLHRSATHQGVVFHPAVRNGMRFWLWLTRGMVTLSAREFAEKYYNRASDAAAQAGVAAREAAVVAGTRAREAAAQVGEAARDAADAALSALHNNDEPLAATG
jgi:hypothetical protein